MRTEPSEERKAGGGYGLDVERGGLVKMPARQRARWRTTETVEIMHRKKLMG